MVDEWTTRKLIDRHFHPFNSLHFDLSGSWSVCMDVGLPVLTVVCLSGRCSVCMNVGVCLDAALSR